MCFHRLYIHVHFIPFVGVHTFSLYHPCLDLFSCFLLVCLKNFRKTKKISCIQFTFYACLVVILKRKPKKISLFFFCLLGAFPCKQFFSFLLFPFICLFKKTKNSKNISVCISEFLFFLLSRTEEKTTMKMLSGSHMHYC